MEVKTMEEIVKDCMVTFPTTDDAIRALSFTIRHLQLTTTLVHPNPLLTEMRMAYHQLYAMNWGRDPDCNGKQLNP